MGEHPALSLPVELETPSFALAIGPYPFFTG